MLNGICLELSMGVAPEDPHHHAVVHFALEELRQDLSGDRREEILGALRRHLQAIKDRR